GRLAIARGWVSAAVVREVYAALAPGSSLAAALVARGALRPDQAQELERELAAREREATVHLAGAAPTVRVGEQHGAGLDAPTVGLPPTPTGPGASAPTLLADG